MKKGYKVKFDKKERETKVAYYNVGMIDAFRKAYLEEYLQGYEEVILSVNTNLIDKSIESVKYGREVEKLLKDTDYEFRIFPVPNTRDKKLFGVKVGTEKSKAFMVLMKLPVTYLLNTFYDAYLKKVDFMMGIKMDQSFEALAHEFQNGFEEYLYNVDGFEYVIYDSALIKSIRTNFDYFPDVAY